MGQPKFYLLIIAVILVVSWLSFNSGPKVIEPQLNTEAPKAIISPANQTGNPPTDPTANSPTVNTSVPPNDNTASLKSGEVRHIDMLSEEMKQSIRDKLFHHGPKETIERDDGVIILPANGRFTQMPVAVQMPDGSIKIQEYSVLPK